MGWKLINGILLTASSMLHTIYSSTLLKISAVFQNVGFELLSNHIIIKMKGRKKKPLKCHFCASCSLNISYCAVYTVFGDTLTGVKSTLKTESLVLPIMKTFFFKIMIYYIVLVTIFIWVI